jgi:hypothetical protein
MRVAADNPAALDARGVRPVTGNVLVFPHGDTAGSLVSEWVMLRMSTITTEERPPACLLMTQHLCTHLPMILPGSRDGAGQDACVLPDSQPVALLATCCDRCMRAVQ